MQIQITDNVSHLHSVLQITVSTQLIPANQHALAVNIKTQMYIDVMPAHQPA